MTSLFRALSERPLRLPRLTTYVPNPDDPSIFWFNSERRTIVEEVITRVVDAHVVDRATLELTLNDTARHEIARLERAHGSASGETLDAWKSVVRRIARMSDEEKRRAIYDTVARMARDVTGNFDPRVYQMASRAVPILLTGVMRPSRFPASLVRGEPPDLGELLTIQGDVEKLRALQRKGALVYVPTHSSNLDSLVLGHALDRSGLAPVIYGAGKNLFTNPIISFFMHNLGAYRVDRTVRANLYKEVLKTYSSVMIEWGYHSLFFPGGTRSRSGLIENRLKLGLAGSAVEAFSRNQVRGIDRRVFFVPTTINYALVLEAETLVEDWLREEGRSRYIIDDDEFSRVDRWVAFFRKLVGLRGACVLRFGEPLDPFGNSVDDEGRSFTPSGATIDSATYVYRGGRATLDPRRDAAYTRELGEVLVERYRGESVLMATQLVAHILFRRLVANTPGMDLFGRIRLRGEISMDHDELVEAVGRARDALGVLEAAGVVRMSPVLHRSPPEELVARALAAWSGYHRRQAAREQNAVVFIEDPTLLLYYQNRLVPFAERIAPEAELAAAREIGRLNVVGASR